jgi:hypothetical protein
MPINKNKLIFLAIMFFCLSIMAASIIYFKQNNPAKNNFKADQPEIKNNEIKKEDAALGTSTIENDLEYYEEAGKSDDPSACQSIKVNISRDLCLQTVAINTTSSTTCKNISDKNIKSNCLDRSILEKAVLTSDINECSAISQKMLKKSCLERIAKIKQNITCDKIIDNDLAVSCISTVNYMKAKKENNSKICHTITDSIIKANCLSEIEKIDLHSDSDKDGLDFLGEILNGTDPDKADSDNDGFKDGTEVSRGFNPDGPGDTKPKEKISLIKCADIKDADIKILCYQEMTAQILDLLNCHLVKNEKLKAYCVINNIYR